MICYLLLSSTLFALFITASTIKCHCLVENCPNFVCEGNHCIIKHYPGDMGMEIGRCGNETIENDNCFDSNKENYKLASVAAIMNFYPERVCRCRTDYCNVPELFKKFETTAPPPTVDSLALWRSDMQLMLTNIENVQFNLKSQLEEKESIIQNTRSILCVTLVFVILCFLVIMIVCVCIAKLFAKMRSNSASNKREDEATSQVPSAVQPVVTYHRRDPQPIIRCSAPPYPVNLPYINAIS